MLWHTTTTQKPDTTVFNRCPLLQHLAQSGIRSHSHTGFIGLSGTNSHSLRTYLLPSEIFISCKERILMKVTSQIFQPHKTSFTTSLTIFVHLDSQDEGLPFKVMAVRFSHPSWAPMPPGKRSTQASLLETDVKLYKGKIDKSHSAS